MDSEFAQYLAVESDLLHFESLDELRVANTLGAQSGVDAHDPEAAEVTLLQLAVAVGVYTSADHGFICLLECGTAHAAVTLRKSANLFVTTVPNNSTFDAHGLKVRDESGETLDVRAVSKDSAW